MCGAFYGGKSQHCSGALIWHTIFFGRLSTVGEFCCEFFSGLMDWYHSFVTDRNEPPFCSVQNISAHPKQELVFF
jgi:hypothetical protein